MQIVLNADSENQFHSSQLADGKLHFLLLFAAAVPYSLGRFGVYSSFSFELLYIQTSLFAMCSDARDTTPNAKCCWCRQQEGRSLRPVGRERGLSAFSHCFWKEQFHTIWRRFNVDSIFLIIWMYIYPKRFLQWSSDARGKTPNAWCCLCWQRKERWFGPADKLVNSVSFFYFWQQFFHTAWRRFDLDFSFSLIFLYSQTLHFTIEFGCQGHNPKCKVLLVPTAR